MKSFVLVHGAMHGGWCWTKVKPLLEAAGATVSTPDLPGSGPDRPPLKNIGLKTCARTLIALLENLPQPPIVVGHSMAGAVIIQAAGLRPELIKKLVFLTAHAINPGESITGNRHLAPEALIAKYMTVDPETGGLEVPLEHRREVLYNRCSAEDAAWAAAKLTPQAPGPFNEALEVDRAVVDALAKQYIICLQDQTIPPRRQEQLAANWTMDHIDRLDADHSAFLSRPRELAKLLLKAV